MTNPTDRDTLLDEYLKGGSEVSRAYKNTSDELPPAHIDARILSEARRTEPPASTVPGPFSSRWMVPASLAVMVVAVSIVALLPESRNLTREVPDFLPESALEPARLEPSAEEASPGKPPGEAGREASNLGSGASRGDLRMPAAPLSDEGVLRFNAAPSADDAGTASPATTAISPAMKQAAPLMEDAVAPRAGSLAPPASSMAPKQELGASVAESDARQKASDAAAQAKQSTEAKEGERRLQRRIEPVIGGHILMPETETAPDSAGRSRSSVGEIPAIPADAETRLERISALINDGDLESARLELRTFRQLYPEIEIPAAIRSALNTVSP